MFRYARNKFSLDYSNPSDVNNRFVIMCWQGKMAKTENDRFYVCVYRDELDDILGIAFFFAPDISTYVRMFWSFLAQVLRKISMKWRMDQPNISLCMALVYALSIIP